jgi:hypothetical protein
MAEKNKYLHKENNIYTFGKAQEYLGNVSLCFATSDIRKHKLFKLQDF